ncbi:MAG: type I glutamate--ammonia ligase [Blastocatellia bacterium]|nr:type I glutamate--ammonia ligase [Blastocatellia bacterium]MCS7157171.1 type I glutamate--ammonia ligase [Blastocatellia bacterium]MCX7752366.1 type I glutamate--ammonia ligase [Blastocatellia bacterium]MDW8167247.1 type I glutamate--ammonia ligase [Acidobacteriota bacterium]
MTPQKVFEYARAHGAKYVDIRFTDLVGQWQHMTFPIEQLKEESFEEGFGFDGSSIRGWAAIHESDMLLIPDARWYWMDPFYEEPTLCLIGDIVDPITRQGYEYDPRGAAKRAEAYMRFTGIADEAYFGPEVEFFIFDEVRYEVNGVRSGYEVRSQEWGDRGYRMRGKEGYVPIPPVDQLQDVRTEIAERLRQIGIEVECHHHEVASGGQGEVDFRYGGLVETADHVMAFKYIVRQVAWRRGKVATFMPKPIFGDNGSGMHCHQSLWKGGRPLFAGEGYAGLSQEALWYIGGLLRHGPALAAFVAPTTNSYRRLVPGFEAPVNLAYSRRNRSAAVRIPMYSANPAAKRLEFRPPDPSCNPYLAFAAMLMAGLDGIQQRIEPGEPLDRDIYDMSPEELKDVPKLPGSLEEALAALEQDHEFLLKGDVFTPALIERWIRYKREREVDAVRLRPHPMEFYLYLDV